MTDASDDIEHIETFIRLVKGAIENLRQRHEAEDEVQDMQRLLDILAVSFCPHCGSELTADYIDQRGH